MTKVKNQILRVFLPACFVTLLCSRTLLAQSPAELLDDYRRHGLSLPPDNANLNYLKERTGTTNGEANYVGSLSFVVQVGQDRVSWYGTAPRICLGQYDVAQLLCKHGVTADVSGFKGDASALQNAIERRDARLVKLPLEHGADVFAGNFWEGMTGTSFRGVRRQCGDH